MNDSSLVMMSNLTGLGTSSLLPLNEDVSDQTTDTGASTTPTTGPGAVNDINLAPSRPTRPNRNNRPSGRAYNNMVANRLAQNRARRMERLNNPAGIAEQHNRSQPSSSESQLSEGPPRPSNLSMGNFSGSVEQSVVDMSVEGSEDEGDSF